MQAKIVLPNEELEYGAVEAIKTLRTNIMYSEDVKAIMLTSTMPSEGKSTVSLELARSFAALGKNTVLMDCDMRKSYLVRRLGIQEKIQGVSEYLSKQSMKIVYRTSDPNLSIIFSGSYPPNPSELLSGIRFESLMETLRDAYDYIIVDTPPMGDLVDGAIISRQVDGTLLVVRNDFVKTKAVKKVKQQIEQNGGRVLGVALNRIKKNQKGAYPYGKKYYSYEYKKEK